MVIHEDNSVTYTEEENEVLKDGFAILREIIDDSPLDLVDRLSGDEADTINKCHDLLNTSVI